MTEIPRQPQPGSLPAEQADVSQDSFKGCFADLPEISADDAVNTLRTGQPLVGKKVPFLHLDYVHFEHEVRFENCWLGGFVARGNRFPKLVIRHCLFSERLEMSARKQDGGEFKKSLVEGDLDIADSRFEESFTLRNAEVHGNLTINNCHIQGPIVVDKSEFAGQVRCVGLLRAEVMSAYRTQFTHNLVLEHCCLPGQEKSLDLNGAHIGGTLLMVDCRLGRGLEMKKADIGGDERQAWQAINCKLSGADIAETFFHGEVLLQQVECDGVFMAEIPKETHGQKSGRSTVFERDVAFVETSFGDRCSFHAAFFKGYANFKKCRFAKGGIFKQAEFLQLCSFWESESGDRLQFDKAHFTGRANFGRVVFAGKSSFNDAIFESDAQFHEAQVQGDIFFGGAQFRDKLTLRGAEFGGGVSMQKMLVEKTFNISASTIADRLILSESEFNGAIVAPGLSVGTWASMANCIVRGSVDMAGLKIGNKLPEQPAPALTTGAGNVDNEETEKQGHDGSTKKEPADKSGKKEEFVPGTFYLSSAVFYHDVDLSHTLVRGNLCLDCLNSYGEMDISDARVAGNVILSQSYFRGTVRCDSLSCAALLSTSARYKEEVSFNSLRCQQVSLRHSSFDGGFTMRSASVTQSINLNNADVDGKADFFKCECPNLYFQNFLADYFLVSRQHLIGDMLSSERSRNYRQAKNEYGILKQAFQTQNHYREMDWAYYRFCRANRRAKKADWKHPFKTLAIFFDWLFLDIGFGYGTRPMNIGLVAILVVLSFASAFYCFPHGIVDAGGRPFAQIQFMDAMYLSLNSFTCMDYGNCGPAFNHWLKYLFSIEGLLGIFLTTLFVATVSRKIIRT